MEFSYFFFATCTAGSKAPPSYYNTTTYPLKCCRPLFLGVCHPNFSSSLEWMVLLCWHPWEGIKKAACHFFASCTAALKAPPSYCNATNYPVNCCRSVSPEVWHPNFSSSLEMDNASSVDIPVGESTKLLVKYQKLALVSKFTSVWSSYKLLTNLVDGEWRSLIKGILTFPCVSGFFMATCKTKKRVDFLKWPFVYGFRQSVPKLLDHSFFFKQRRNLLGCQFW